MLDYYVELERASKRLGFPPLRYAEAVRNSPR